MTVYGKWKGGGEARREESGSVNATWLRNSSVPWVSKQPTARCVLLFLRNLMLSELPGGMGTKLIEQFCFL